ncbi:rRNA biogenesis protein rrp36 [Actinomortierella ambigua]|nr:rRNA biogenesis protein rrp36 [Actinomortierella ambigua]
MAKVDDRALRRMQAFDDNEDDSGSDQGSVEWESASEMESDVGDYSDSEEDEDASQEGMSEDEEEEESEDDEDEDDDDEDSEDDDDDEDSEDSGSDSDSNARKLRELEHNLSQIPFDKLAEIQQKVGIKAFQKTLRGGSKGQGAAKSSKSKRPVESDGDSDSDESDSDDSGNEQPRGRAGKMDRLLAMGKEKRERKTIAKRDNKNRPMEVTSKKPVGRFRQVVEVPAAKRRDPRFDSLSGKLNEDLFERSYGFLKDYQQDEMKKLRELIKKEKNQELKEKMQGELSRMVDRQSTDAARKRQMEIKREHKRKERDLIAQGKKPFFLKRADQKKLALIEKFESLKGSPKALSKAMERRRKRNAAKEKTKVLGVKRRRVD